MRHDYLDNTPLDEAKKKYFSFLAGTGFQKRTEVIPVLNSNGRTLAGAVRAKMCSPHYNASAMDGIAVRSRDTSGAAEQTPVTLQPGQYLTLDTGDPVPGEFDSVIMIEDVTDGENGSVMISAASHPWQNIRQVGEDICMGDMIAVTGTVITPSLCGALLAGGITEVEVIARPVFGIIPTGDEIVKPKPDPGEGEIIEFNSAIFSSMLSDMKADSIIYDIVPDKKELIRAAIERAVSECDAVLVLAGSSAGRDDYTSLILSQLGQVIIHGIAIKPGKPAVLGAVGDTPVVGLPGYPVSAIVVMDEIVSGITDMYYGSEMSERTYIDAVMGKTVVSSLKYREYIRVTLGRTGDTVTAVPLGRGAGVITSFTKADGIIELPQNLEGIEKGQTVRVRLLKPENKINSALIITGSHDPVIDETADILRQNGATFSVVSAHVGSMGAITAVKAGQAHLGAIHLLDEETGEYNKAYMQKYFPDGSAVLVRGIGRVQGIMTAKGNPLGIKEFKDITRVRYVNRQRGSGTRILCDCLLKKYEIDKNGVRGYNEEEFTHTAVAALIAAGNADAGLGIYSAAKMYGLEFIPVCTEEYDFLVGRQYLDDPRVRAFIKTLHSREFALRAEKLGGYILYGD